MLFGGAAERSGRALIRWVCPSHHEHHVKRPGYHGRPGGNDLEHHRGHTAGKWVAICSIAFGSLNVGAGNTANFCNAAACGAAVPLGGIQNILGRVTGSQVSNIFGTIQTTGFGTANLFLMNPSGWIFGPTASLNVGGSFHATTADYIRLQTTGTASMLCPRVPMRCSR